MSNFVEFDKEGIWLAIEFEDKPSQVYPEANVRKQLEDQMLHALDRGGRIMWLAWIWI